MDEDRGFLFSRWRGLLTCHQVKKACKAMAQYIEQHNVKSYLSDQSYLKVVPKEVRNYFMREWCLSVEKLG